MKLQTAVKRAISGLELAESDKGTVELALTYTRAIDGDGDLARLGPALLSCLESLGMTPRARAALVKGAERGSGANPLDELRQRRRARVNAAASVDAPTG